MAEEDRFMTESRRNWSELQLELLELILKRLALVDMTRFKLVSKSWYAAAKSYISSPVTYKPLVTQSPWLSLPPRLGDSKDDGLFYSLSEQKVYIFRNLFEGIGDYELLGSSHGWLVIRDCKLLTIHLFNPISRVRILLPPLGFDYYWILRALLSSDPSCNNTFYVVVVYAEKEDIRTAFHKHGDDEHNTATWTDLDSVEGGFGIIFFHNSILYGMCLDLNSIRVCDIGATTSPIKTIDFQPPERGNRGHYLVESQGEVLFVEKHLNLNSGQLYYDIHRLNFTPNKVECSKVDSLQERALILTKYGWASKSLSTLDIPELDANSIYVAQEKLVGPVGGVYFENYVNVEAYNLETKGFKSIFTTQVRGIRPLIWIVPNPCEV